MRNKTNMNFLENYNYTHKHFFSQYYANCLLYGKPGALFFIYNFCYENIYSCITLTLLLLILMFCYCARIFCCISSILSGAKQFTKGKTPAYKFGRKKKFRLRFMDYFLISEHKKIYNTDSIVRKNIFKISLVNSVK